MCVGVWGCVGVCAHLYLYFYAAVANGKRKVEAQGIFLIRSPFANHANGSLSFVRLLTKVIRLQTV